jgi:hypothetical protein
MLSPLGRATILTIILLQFQLKFWPSTELELEWGSSVFKLPWCLVTAAMSFSITYLMNMYIIIYPLMISTETIFSHFLFSFYLRYFRFLQCICLIAGLSITKQIVWSLYSSWPVPGQKQPTGLNEFHLPYYIDLLLRSRPWILRQYFHTYDKLMSLMHEACSYNLGSNDVHNGENDFLI